MSSMNHSRRDFLFASAFAAVGLPVVLGRQAPALAAEAADAFVPPQSPRTTLNFNHDWKFIRQDVAGAEAPAFDDKPWSDIATPHSFNDVDSFRNLSSHSGGDTGTYKGLSWYRKHFKLPAAAAGHKVFIEFEGMRQAGDIYQPGNYTLAGSTVTGATLNNYSSVTNVFGKYTEDKTLFVSGLNAKYDDGTWSVKTDVSYSSAKRNNLYRSVATEFYPSTTTFASAAGQVPSIAVSGGDSANIGNTSAQTVQSYYAGIYDGPQRLHDEWDFHPRRIVGRDAPGRPALRHPVMRADRRRERPLLFEQRGEMFFVAIRGDAEEQDRACSGSSRRAHAPPASRFASR